MANEVSYIVRLRNRFSAEAARIRASTDSMVVGINNAIPKTRTLSNELKQARKRLQDIGSSIKDTGKQLTLFATLPIALVTTSMVNAATDAEETASKFATVFSSITSKADSLADNLAKNYGLSSLKSKQLLSDTGDLLTGFGFSQKSALDLSNEVQKLAVDLASFTNFSGGAEGASQALTKALLGERESIKSLGIAILEEDVKTRVAINSAKGMRFETERQAKAFATLQLAQEQSKNAIGDYARTSESLANRQRELSSRFLDLKVKLGNILLPVVTKIINKLIKLTEWITNLSPETQKWILIVGGVVAILGPLLIVLGGIVSILPLMAAGFAILTSPIILIVAAILGVIAALVLLKKNWSSVKDAIVGTIEQIWINFEIMIMNVVDKVKSFAEMIIGIIKGIPGIGTIMSTAMKGVSMIFDGMDSIGSINSTQVSRTDVNVNLSAPQGAIQSVKSRTTGKSSGLNVGVNMAEQL